MRKIKKSKMWFTTSLLVVIVVIMAGCGKSNSNGGGSADTFGSVCAGASCVSVGASGDLAAASGYVVLAKTGISNTGTSAITGNLGLSPAAASFMTGFSLVADATNVFSRSSLVTGNIYASDYAPPTPVNLTGAVSGMQTAYTAAAGKTSTAACPGSGNMSGLTLAPGVYTCAVDVTIPTDLTLSGSATDVWVFQITGKLTQSSATKVLLTGGALAQNVFWQVSSDVTIGTTAHIEGIILGQTLIALQTGASMRGRALAQSAVTLDANAITVP